MKLPKIAEKWNFHFPFEKPSPTIPNSGPSSGVEVCGESAIPRSRGPTDVGVALARLPGDYQMNWFEWVINRDWGSV